MLGVLKDGSDLANAPNCDAMVIGPAVGRVSTEADPYLVDQTVRALVERLHPLDLIGAANLQMILQITADAGEFVFDGDAVLAQGVAETDARQL